MSFIKPISERKAKETALTVSLIVFAIFFILS